MREGIAVDLFDCLPTPYGLVRAGVAPDHPKIKSVARVFERTAAHPAVRFFGGIGLGEVISRAEILERFTAVVYAMGTELDTRLGIPGEELSGSHPATHFVCWYNGHPSHAHRRFDLDGSRAVVVGNGNVALDVARMLVLPDEALRRTDAADHAIDALAASAVRQVTVLGRRGPVQAAFSTPELLELGRLDGVDVVVDPADLQLDPHSARELAAQGPDSPTARRVALLTEFSRRSPTPGNRRIELRFLRSPVEILGDPAAERVTGVRAAHSALELGPDGRVVARPTGRHEVLPCGLVVRAVGYRARPVEGLPLEPRTGVLRNVAGRLVDAGGAALPGEYVVGWAKRGPSGVIGTNKSDAEDTVAALLDDLHGGRLDGRPSATPDEVEAWIRRSVPAPVDWDAWLSIDRHERASGEPLGRPRVKLTALAEMHAVVHRARTDVITESAQLAP
ncbi:NADP oxidoreductase [Streptomyces sp. NPDC090499]|uniref:NADP oxidoreductase n=1 Tax=Streptomyces sp. NPDC090499 TaxID=3365965 RepID=UPI00380B88C6